MARAMLDGQPLPRGINGMGFGYTMNTQTYDTLGGRVVQLLSVKVDTLQISAHAGSRDALLQMFDFVAATMEVQTMSELPVRLEIPSRDWAFDVWVVAMPAMRFDVQTVAYEYQLRLEVEQASDEALEVAETAALQRLASDIGFDPSHYTWTDIEIQDQLNQTTDAVNVPLGTTGIGEGGRIP